jgi:hypothetical protein
MLGRAGCCSRAREIAAGATDEGLVARFGRVLRCCRRQLEQGDGSAAPARGRGIDARARRGDDTTDIEPSRVDDMEHAVRVAVVSVIAEVLRVRRHRGREHGRVPSIYCAALIRRRGSARAQFAIYWARGGASVGQRDQHGKVADSPRTTGAHATLRYSSQSVRRMALIGSRSSSGVRPLAAASAGQGFVAGAVRGHSRAGLRVEPLPRRRGSHFRNAGRTFRGERMCSSAETEDTELPPADTEEVAEALGRLEGSAAACASACWRAALSGATASPRRGPCSAVGLGQENTQGSDPRHETITPSKTAPISSSPHNPAISPGVVTPRVRPGSDPGLTLGVLRR